jgi:hypothetical protein
MRALLTLLLLGCASTPDDGKEPRLTVTSPPGVAVGADPAVFRTSVNPVFERRCGSLDCHGQRGRGLIIYSANGLRFSTDGGSVPGGSPTTQDEINANYASIVGLQPEKMNEFLAKSDRTSDDAYRLIILAKPLALERHKGGPALSRGDAAEQCITGWLLGKVDTTRCAVGAAPP